MRKIDVSRIHQQKRSLKETRDGGKARWILNWSTGAFRHRVDLRQTNLYYHSRPHAFNGGGNQILHKKAKTNCAHLAKTALIFFLSNGSGVSSHHRSATATFAQQEQHSRITQHLNTNLSGVIRWLFLASVFFLVASTKVHGFELCQGVHLASCKTE